MINIDPELKLKLAKAARELAAELEAGTAPTLGFGQLFNPDGTPCCAMGHVYDRAGVAKSKHPDCDAFLLVKDAVPREAAYVAYPVENANDSQAPWIKAAIKDPPSLPRALRDYAFAVEGL